ncbi:hypothetical protein [Noviherbaspirillum pedocola]|uniref:Uncharacterized protein n=1 Tax=Noviherbaspirillum pedocola TaxID=2801341 RepID=A0A934W223_9BURK|nr:hypothetical protein [Noviherbaspirillum pedocola]MBK4735836.1 hypothetical protein [Noviherbaspirillum pedocola]
MAADVLSAWDLERDCFTFTYTFGKGLPRMSNEELEDFLVMLARIEEEESGWESGLLTCVRFKVVRDHDVTRGCQFCAHCAKTKRSRSGIKAATASSKKQKIGRDFEKLRE